MAMSNERLAHELTMQYLTATFKIADKSVSEYVSEYFARYNDILKEVEKRHKPDGSDSESDFGAQW